MTQTTNTATDRHIEVADGKHVSIHFEAQRCIHSRHCVLGQPGVFLANVEGEWIKPDAASAEDGALVAQACPSGAITSQRNDGAPDEPLPKVNVARVRENGPLAVLADLRIAGQALAKGAQRTRATLCRCGASKKKPFCDGSHAEAKFIASGEAPVKESQPLAQRDGLLMVSPQKTARCWSKAIWKSAPALATPSTACRKPGCAAAANRRTNPYATVRIARWDLWHTRLLA